MSSERKIRDPIHHFIHLGADEAEIIDTPLFQRLRGIRQLALANLVYPGANHSRFEHSLGVHHVANMMADALKLIPGDKRLVGFAALLHDIGHGPFSHVSEASLNQYADKEKLKGKIGKADKIHELLTADLLNQDEKIRNILGGNTVNDVIKLLSDGLGEPVNRSLVSGPLDADKQDYLLRDSYFCGVTYGHYDIHQLHRSFVRFQDPSSDHSNLAISKDGIHSLEQFVLAKYYLTTQVYRHRIRIITDQMLTRAIKLGIEKDEIDRLRDLYAYDGSVKFVNRYKQWNDAKFFTEFGESRRYKNTACQELLKRLQTRNLLKRVFSCQIKELGSKCRETIMAISEPENAKKRQKAEAELAEVIERHTKRAVQKHMVIIHSHNIKSVRTLAANDESQVLIIDPEGTKRPKEFDKTSTLFKSIDNKLNEARVEVMAPVTNATNKDKKDLVKKLEYDIRKVLNRVR